LLASVTWSAVSGVRATSRSNPATGCEKSDGVATATPFSSIVAEETRWRPSASPLTTCRTWGDTTQEGTAMVSV
jgi:hypothetical protein